MVGSIIISIFVLIVIFFIYVEYKNEKKYQEERHQKQQGLKKEEKQSRKKSNEVPVEPRNKEKLIEKKTKAKKQEAELLPKHVIIPKIDLPKANYPQFDHTRLIGMGLSEDEAKEYVQELIPQIASQIPLLKEAIQSSDFYNMERLTHSIKGSATTVGTGGVSDLLSDFNTYLKTGREAAIVEVYFEHLIHYHEELKEQYS